ncbi:MAG TPA: non-canonical purine NTP pyrophosphatase [Terriglobia bacterium]
MARSRILPTDESLEVWLASSNPGKLREFAETVRGRGIRVKALPGMDGLPPCIEDGATFEENARKKAAYYSRGFDGLVFADDSGLCVDALGGAPGVLSARFAGPRASDEANNAKLIERLRHALDPSGWNRRESEGSDAGQTGAGTGTPAHYLCVIALARRGQVCAVTEGRADGVIVPEPRGSGGFGYDPYFFYPPLDQTFAELGPEAKFAVSHRGEAFRRLLEVIARPEFESRAAEAPSTSSGTGDDLPVLS